MLFEKTHFHSCLIFVRNICIPWWSTLYISLYSGQFAYIDESRDVWLETAALPWKPFYETLGFCLQFQFLLLGKSGSSYLTVFLKFNDTQQVAWKLVGYHGDQWSFSQVSWRPRRSIKVVQYVACLGSQKSFRLVIVIVINNASWFLVCNL